MNCCRGVIALDIDGTVTRSDHSLPREVAQFLERLGEEGWQIAFVTGRSFAYGHSTLQHLPFDYLFACENGATLIQMPERRIIHSADFGLQELAILQSVAAELKTEILIHTGIEAGGHCYWRPHLFSDEMRTSLRRREAMTTESWISVDSFDEIGLTHFVYVKCFGPKEMLERFAALLEERGRWAISIIRDPLEPSRHIALITHPEGGKGGAVRYLRTHYAKGGQVIAAGDDLNDLPMFKEADIAIAMEGAPEPLIESADIVAPPADQMGIIQAIQQAIQ